MLGFLVRRITGAIVTLAIIAGMTFVLFFAVPADPARLSCGKVCPPDALAIARKNLGLDQPIFVQFLEWGKAIFVGRDYPGMGRCDAPCLGFSFVNQEPVLNSVLDRLPVTLSLSAGGILVFLAIGIATGTIAALRQGKAVDKVATSTSLLGDAMQIYFVGPLLMWLLVYQSGILPRPTYTPLTEDPLAWFTGLMLPWFVLSLIFTAGYTRITRSYMIEALSEDYVRTARAKGMSRRTVIWRFAFRGTVIPVITMLAVTLGNLVGGAIITETTFGLNGIGRLSVDAVVRSDLPVLVAVVMVGAAAIVLANLIVDLAYASLDPRIRLS